VQTLLRLLTFARPFWRTFLLLNIAAFLGSVIAVLQPWPLKILIDQVIGGAALPAKVEMAFKDLGVISARDTLLVLVVAGGLVLFGLQSALDTAISWGWTVTGRRMVYHLAGDLFHRLQRRSLIYHSRARVGETLTRITGDCWVLYQLVDGLIFRPVQAVFIIGTMGFLMAQLDTQLMVIALITAPVIVATSRFAGRRLRSTAEVRRGIEGNIRSHIQQTLTGMPVVQAFAQEEREQLRFRRLADTMVRAQQHSALIDSVNKLGAGLIAGLGSAVVLWLGALRVLDGAMTIGTLLVFMAYLQYLQGQVKTLAAIYPLIQSLSAGIDRLDEVLRITPEITDAPDAQDILVRGEVTFEGVTFCYDLGSPVLQGITLRAESGQTIALVGPTGSGKTTLVSLIPRFFDPTEGRVLIDGRDLTHIRLTSLRSQVALVLQDPFLFPLSIAENIAYGRPDASMAEIEAAAYAANAHDFIRRLPEGYATVLGERGTTLSGGERQRLSIARALLLDAPILILDEPTSALDPGTESLIMDAMRTLIRGRTTFIIAHRLSTVRHADIVVVLDQGRIAELGHPSDLLRRQSLFTELHKLQADPMSATSATAGRRP
jgi:ATP-binding cassette, subfamily B, bacterial